MKCKNCGIEITEDCKFCTNCGTPIGETTTQENNSTPSTQKIEPTQTVVNNNANTLEDDKKANKLCIISLVLKYIPSIIIGGVYGAADSYNSIANALTLLLGLGPVVALILMIYVRVKYPKNTFGKVLMWLYIIEIVLSLIALVIIMITCAGILNSCKGM